MLPLVRTPVVPLRTCPLAREGSHEGLRQVVHETATPHVFTSRVQGTTRAPTHIKAEVSLVIEINQKNQSTHFPKAMHYFHAQNQERAAVCLSSRCSELVRFLALSQIKPQAPLLVVLLPSILLNFIIANIHSTKTAVGFPHSASCVGVGV